MELKSENVSTYFQVADLPHVLREMMESNDVGFGRMGDGVLTPAQLVADRNPRNRFKPRLQAKGMSSLSNIPEINRRTIRSVEANKRIVDMKTEPNTGNLTQLGTELPIRLPCPPPSTTITANANAVRRDSISSNASSFYYSMKSADVSRRSSQASQHSTMLSPPSAAAYAMRPPLSSNNVNYAASSFYDPISPGSSRRSSEMSTTTTGGQSLPPPPSSHLLSAHLQRLQQASLANPLFSMSNRLSVPSISTIGSDLSSANDLAMHMNPCVPDRRMSEPVNFGANEKPLLSPPERPRSVTPKLGSAMKLNSGAASAATTVAPINVEQHPNREVDLDEVEEGEMVEDKLIIPEEFKNYLNQVADIESGAANNGNTTDDVAPEKTQSCSNANNQAGFDKTPKNESQQSSNAHSQAPFNTNVWRNQSSNMYSMSSPLTQPQSPSSVISQILPPSPQHMMPNEMKPPVHRQQLQHQRSPMHNEFEQSQNAASASNFENQGYVPPPPYPMYYNQQNHSNASQIPSNQYNSFNGASPANNAYAMATNNCNNMYNMHMGYGNNSMTTPMHNRNQMLAAAACTQTPGYYHRTDQSAMNCCQLMRALQISDNSSKCNLGMKSNQSSATQMKITTSTTTTTTTTLTANTANPFASGNIQMSNVNICNGTNMNNIPVNNLNATVNATSAIEPNQVAGEIQCGDISQSQLSPRVPEQMTPGKQ